VFGNQQAVRVAHSSTLTRASVNLRFPEKSRPIVKIDWREPKPVWFARHRNQFRRAKLDQRFLAGAADSAVEVLRRDR
jgi:hypothetical protein